VPGDLVRRVKALLAKDPTLSWDAAIDTIARREFAEATP
jgi:hypothetical protein